MSMFWCARCDNAADADDGCEEYGHTALMCADCLSNLPEIKASLVHPPIPIRNFDWSAVTEDYDGAPDAGWQPVGHGKTRGDAIRDLVGQIDEHAAE